jgi:hypothetical protein
MYPATLLVNGVKSDFGTSRSAFSYSRILINDKRNVIRNLSNNRVIGYLGMDVGNAKINAVPLPKTDRPFRTYSSFSPQWTAGSAYTLVDQDNASAGSFVYVPGQNYRFVADGHGAVSSFELGIRSPDEITVLQPRAGSVVFRDVDLQIRWNGNRGDSLRVTISSFDAQANIPVKPILQLNVVDGANSIIIPAKILKALPQNGDGHFLFSVISSNMSVTNIPGYSENVLVQASSIHNILLWLK